MPSKASDAKQAVKRVVGQVRKRKNRQKIDPMKFNSSMELNETGLDTDEKKGLSSMHQIAKITVGAIKTVASAKKAAGRWRGYVTSKRRMAAEANSSNNNKNGQGLADISSSYTQPGARRKSTAATNRAVIQYFAKLGQSVQSDECLDLDFIEGLINQGADVNCTDTHGQTLLHEVARTWHPDVGKFLLEHGGEINKADNYGRTPLHVAAAVDYADMCEFLIENGADKEARTTGERQTPLFYAARNDATKALDALIKAGCEYKEVRDYRERTPLYVAAELDRSETARHLLEEHAPVGVVDDCGQPALTWMISKMAPVAKDAMDQLHTCDRANRKQYFYLNHLEPIKAGEERCGYAQFPLEILIHIKNFDLILHPVIWEIIKVKWKSFGKLGAWRQIALQAVFVTLWTIIALHSPWFSKCQYILPNDIWKIIVYVAAVGITIYQIVDELNEFISSQRDHEKWRNWREAQIDEDIKYCHPRWPEEKIFLENEKEQLDQFKSNYFQDFWNIFDWICYAFLLASTITHVVDVMVPSLNLARWHNRIMAINIMLVWLRTMKYVRCFSALGPFIVMLSEMAGDVGKFAYLYFQFFIPFACAFWMCFGGNHVNEVPINGTCVANNLAGEASNLINIKGMVAADEMIFTLFRLTLVDEYDLDNMLIKDKYMAYALLFLWFFISAILCLNLLIALLSDTFQRVYDNAKANAVMQKAITVLAIEEKLFKKRLNEYRNYIESKCSPEVLYYDDDTGEGADELKKVTIQTKDKVNEVIDLWHAKFGEPNEDEQGGLYYTSSDDSSDGGSDGGDGDGDGGKRVKRKASQAVTVTNAKLENEIDILRAELTQVDKKRKDFERKCMSELSIIKNLLMGGQGVMTGAPVTRLPPLNLPEYQSNVSLYHSMAPPTYPAAVAERLTPRDDQVRGGDHASVSHVDIATLPSTGGDNSNDLSRISMSPAVRIHQTIHSGGESAHDNSEV